MQNINRRATRILGVAAGPKSGSARQTMQWVRSHLTWADLERLRTTIGQSRPEFARVVGVSERTLSRYADQPKLVDPATADRALRIARMEALAEYVLEDKQAGREWLDTPQPSLNGEIPRTLLASEFGAREVETALQQIEYGVYV